MMPPHPQGGEKAEAIDEGVRLEVLYRTERNTLLRFFMRHRATPTEANDLAQEAFLRFANIDDGTRNIARPASYLRQIGRNLLRNEAKSGERLSQATDPAVFELTASDVDEVARLEARDSLRRIEAAMMRLKPKTRAIFLASRIDGMTYTQIAEKTGMSVKGVEKQMGKAIAAIGVAMERRR